MIEKLVAFCIAMDTLGRSFTGVMFMMFFVCVATVVIFGTCVALGVLFGKLVTKISGGKK